MPLSEIIVSNGGLVFKSEDGTPLLKIEKNEFGTYASLLGPEGKPVVSLDANQGRGGLTVGSKNGGYAYINGHEDSATILLLGKYGKDVIEITSSTSDGGGHIAVKEGSQGDKAVEIGAGPNKVKSKGTIKVFGENGPVWEAPQR